MASNLLDEPIPSESIYENQLVDSSLVGERFEQQQVPVQEGEYANQEQLQLVDTSGASGSGAEADASLLVNYNPDADRDASTLAEQQQHQQEEQEQQEHTMAARSPSTMSKSSAGASKPGATDDLLKFDSPQHAPAPSPPPAASSPARVPADAYAEADTDTSSPPQARGNHLSQAPQQQVAEAEPDDARIEMRNNHSAAAAFAAEFQQGAGQSASSNADLCASCGQRVFLVERLVVQKRSYHKPCFKCERCKRTLGITDYAMAGDHVYCKTHYMELFRQRGKYDFAPDTLPPPAEPTGDEFQNQPEMPKITDIKSRFEHATSPSDASAAPAAQREIGGSGQLVQARLEAFKSHQGGGGDGVPKPRAVDMPHRTMRHDGVGKVAENAPTDLPSDVVRSDFTSKHEEELPQANTAKSIMNKFKEMQASSTVAPPRPDQSAHKPSQLRKSWQQPPTNGEAGAADASGASADVVRSGGPSIATDELPSEGTARSALSVFQQKQEAASKSAAAPQRQFKFQVDDPKRRAAKLSVTKPPDARANQPADEEAPPTGPSDVSGAGATEELPAQGTAKALAARWSTQSTGGAQ